jgi:hypothetical protein
MLHRQQDKGCHLPQENAEKVGVAPIRVHHQAGGQCGLIIVFSPSII